MWTGKDSPEDITTFDADGENLESGETNVALGQHLTKDYLSLLTGMDCDTLSSFLSCPQKFLIETQ